jgi:retron-type reverse transcriptase
MNTYIDIKTFLNTQGSRCKDTGKLRAPVRLLGYPSRTVITEELVNEYERLGLPMPELPCVYPKANTPPACSPAGKVEVNREQIQSKLLESYPDLAPKQKRYLTRNLQYLRKYAMDGNYVKYSRLARQLLYKSKSLAHYSILHVLSLDGMSGTAFQLLIRANRVKAFQQNYVGRMLLMCKALSDPHFFVRRIKSNQLDLKSTNLKDTIQKAQRFCDRVNMPLRVEIPKPNSNDVRPLTIPHSIERVRQTMLMNISSPYVEQIWKEESVGFRYRRNRITSHICLLDEGIRRFGQGKFEFLTADLKKYYDFIPHANMKKVIKEIPLGRPAQKFLVKTMMSPIMKSSGRKEWQPIYPDKGTPQGSVISPLLANHNMHNFDKQCISKGIVFRRFADNIDLCRPLDNSQGTREEFIATLESFIPDGTTMHPTSRPDKTQWITTETDRRTLGIYLDPEKSQVDCVMAYGLEEDPNPIDARKLKLEFPMYKKTWKEIQESYPEQEPPLNPTECYRWTSQRNEDILSIRLIWSGSRILQDKGNASGLKETVSIQDMILKLKDPKYKTPLRRYLNTKYTRYLNSKAHQSLKSEVRRIFHETIFGAPQTALVPNQSRPITHYVNQIDDERVVTPDNLPRYFYYRGRALKANLEQVILGNETTGYDGITYYKYSYIRQIEKKDGRTYDNIYKQRSTTYDTRIRRALQDPNIIRLIEYIAELNSDFNETVSRSINHQSRGNIHRAIVANQTKLRSMIHLLAQRNPHIPDMFKEFIQDQIEPDSLRFREPDYTKLLATTLIPLHRSDARFIKAYDRELDLEFYPYPDTKLMTYTTNETIYYQAPKVYQVDQATRPIPHDAVEGVIIGSGITPEPTTPEQILEQAQIDQYLTENEQTMNIDDYAMMLFREFEPYIKYKAIEQRLERAIERIAHILAQAGESYEARRTAQYEHINDIESEIYGIHTVINKSVDSGYAPSIDFMEAYRRNRGSFHKRAKVNIPNTLGNAQYHIYNPLIRLTY